MRRNIAPSPRLAAGLLLTATLLAALPGAARTIGVPDDAPSIGAAMALARAGDIILVGCGTYEEVNIQVTPGVSLWSGTLQPDCTVIDAGGRGRVLEFTNCDSTTAVVGITVRGGYTENDGGAIICRNSAPRFSRCTIRDSHARRGGGIACEGSRAPRFEDCLVTGNDADLQGGGILWNSPAEGRISRCTIENNTALAGGGVASLQGNRLRLSEVAILANQAAASGGGIWVGDGSLQVSRSVIARNHGGLGGGAMACSGGRPSLVACTVVDNEAEATTGGLLIRGGMPRVERTIVAFNGATPADVSGTGQLDLTSCNVFGHAGGNWPGPLSVQADRGGNFSLDPRFCSRRSGLFDLSALSPCLPGNRTDGALVGARGQGCN